MVEESNQSRKWLEKEGAKPKSLISPDEPTDEGDMNDWGLPSPAGLGYDAGSP